MHKQLRIITSHRLAVCPLSSSLFPVPGVSHLAFSRHLRRLPVHYHPIAGVSVYYIPTGWFIWCVYSGESEPPFRAK